MTNKNKNQKKEKQKSWAENTQKLRNENNHGGASFKSFLVSLSSMLLVFDAINEFF